MLKSDLYRVLRTELHRHDLSTFIDGPPCIAQGGQVILDRLSAGASPRRYSLGELKEMGEKLNMAGQAFDISPPGATPSLSPV
jgi:hypothetical protein